ncbi:transporter [Alcaligenaceae bacterium LF4-65]|jgi:hypothetical protein|uniref:Transporter n=1 Tax=Zwartia hollandica TaxID=324606 RepID=A0A953T6F6_9BURK|nr:transporter [Zwartia hollandica]MBZ1349759.1 transporter [Zwartia hollandica]
MQTMCKAILFVSVFIPALCRAIDLQPNDAVAPIPDKTFAMLSYYGTENGTLYRNGSAVSTPALRNPLIENNSAILRLSRSYSLFGLPAVSLVQVPYSDLQLGGSLSNLRGASGVADISLATAIWPYANRNTRTYFGMMGFLTLPTGNYANDRVFNVGENRYRLELQLAFQTPIAGNLDGMIAVDTRWFGANSGCAAACASATNATLNQKPLTTLQLGPIYKINQTFTAGASYFYINGGSTSINGLSQNNEIKTQRFLLSLLAYTDIGRFSLQYGRDMDTFNGFAQSRVLALRYMRSF